MPVAVRYKARVCGRSLAGIASSNPAGEWVSVCFDCWVIVQVSAMRRSVVQRSRTDCGASLCVMNKPQKMRRSWPELGCCARGKNEWKAYRTYE